MNKVELVGNVASDIRSSVTGKGNSVANFLLAVQREFPFEGADFIQITAFKEIADEVKDHKKGTKLNVIGSISTRSYEKDGVKRYITEIIAKKVELVL